MAMKSLKVEVTADSRVDRFWVKVADKDVVWKSKPSNTIEISTGRHKLVYWAVGTPGGRLTIKATVAGETIFERKSKIPRDGDVADSVRITVV